MWHTLPKAYGHVVNCLTHTLISILILKTSSLSLITFPISQVRKQVRLAQVSAGSQWQNPGLWMSGQVYFAFLQV